MGIILDIIIIIILVRSVIGGYKNGILYTISHFFCMAITVAVSYALSRWVGDYLFINQIQPYLQELLIDQMASQGAGLEQTLQSALNLLPEVLSNLPQFLTQDKKELLDALASNNAILNQADLANQLIAITVKPIFSNLLSSILFFIVSIFTYPVLRFIIRRLDMINKIPMIGTANQMLGGLFGIGVGCVWVFVFLFFVKIAIMVTGNNFDYLNQSVIESSYIFDKIYNLSLFQSSF